MDGAETLTEAAGMLRELADELLDLERDGWQLEDEVTDDYAILRKKRAPRKKVK